MRDRGRDTFSQSGYRALVKVALSAGYLCVPFAKAMATPSKAMILRHDVDFSIQAALRMAVCEHELGVSSTYFIMVANDYYNPFAQANRQRLKQIVDMGHEVGLHWDSSIYPADCDRLGQHFRHEVQALSDVTGQQVISASQHIPTDSPLFDVEAHITHEAYSQKWRERFAYVSDSSMAWRAKTPWDLIEEGVDIHFLSHPIWWFTDGDGRDVKLRNAIKSSTDHTISHSETFITYMNKILADRAAVDAAFRANKGWS
jgi:hypothetical protein